MPTACGTRTLEALNPHRKSKDHTRRLVAYEFSTLPQLRRPCAGCKCGQVCASRPGYRLLRSSFPYTPVRGSPDWRGQYQKAFLAPIMLPFCSHPVITHTHQTKKKKNQAHNQTPSPRTPQTPLNSHACTPTTPRDAVSTPPCPTVWTVIAFPELSHVPLRGVTDWAASPESRAEAAQVVSVGKQQRAVPNSTSYARGRKQRQSKSSSPIFPNSQNA
ncbi:hypothetical protein B0T25DRAFT_116414 [Lasiosphaeria hispida]|uniref:Uncharacterized protein n=1 Tax=Lasiosphaeria hispida TaxID=260671 RepID=A0AAJ0HRN2_9PEZI|nr:hypothetical protein B0T25DRAFT_116414 [Lasiosphaeria hispida]